MIIVVGHSLALEGAEEEMQRLALEHVMRSRAEPGCISHEVSRDAQLPRRFVFVERWADLAALQAHFGLEASRQFARAVSKLSDEKPTMTLYRAEAIDLTRGGPG